MLVLTYLLLIVLDKVFYTLLLLIRHQDTKFKKNQELNFSKKLNISVLSHIKFYLEDDDHKPVDFNGETISFNCQLIKL